LNPSTRLRVNVGKGLSERFFAALLRNKRPNLHHTRWIPAFAGMFMSLQLVLDHENEPGGLFFGGMTKTTRPSFRASSARPGIQESHVSASTVLSALRYRGLRMTVRERFSLEAL